MTALLYGIAGVHLDAFDLDHFGDPDCDLCVGCGHTYPTDELTRDRGGDLVCADCVDAWADHPDRRP